MDWTFNGLWPYAPRWFDTPDGRMHYVDEGPRDGKPVVLVHGNPTWSFLYRNFIPPLVKAGYRVIAFDHLGFGRSDKPDRPELYAITRHAQRAEALLESFDLRDATAVVQDWGGTIGLWWATQHPDRLRGLFILNTSAHRPRGPVNLPLRLLMFRAPAVGEVMVKGLDLFKRAFLFRAGVMHQDRLTQDVKRAYRAPHLNWSSRTPVLAFPRQIPSSPDGPVADLAEKIERGLERDFRSKPVGIAWGMKDMVFPPDVLKHVWLGTFPHAKVLRIDDAGHFLQEDAHERIVPALIEHLNESATASGVGCA